MKCPKCSTENPETRKFCRECGEKLVLKCPKCNSENLPGDKFCGECGCDLSTPGESPPIDYEEPQSYTQKHLADKILNTRSAIEGERKLVTVLFADVANFTAMAETGCPSADTCEYRECLIDESTGAPSAWPHCRGDLRQLYYSGFQNRLWHPQYHGRSHFDVQAWLSYLRSDEVAQKYFRRGMVFCNDTSLDTNQHPRTLLSEHVREHTIPGVSENNPSQVS